MESVFIFPYRLLPYAKECIVEHVQTLQSLKYTVLKMFGCHSFPTPVSDIRNFRIVEDMSAVISGACS